MGMFPYIGLAGVPDLGGEDLCHRVLDHTRHIGRKPLPASARPFDPKLIQLAVAKEHLRQVQFPVAAADRFQGIGLRPFPVVKLPYEIDTACIGGPFPQHPGAVVRAVQAVIEVVVDGIFQRSVPGNVPFHVQDPLMPCFDGSLVRCKPGVCLVNGFHRLSIFSCMPRR